jgi:hypothetical protein
MIVDHKTRQPLVISRSQAKPIFSAVLVGMLSVLPAAAQIHTTPSLKERLAPFITTAPEIVQFAKDGKFEKAWIIRRSGPRPSDEDCRKYIQKEKFQVLILEYVWNFGEDDRRFVLTLLQDKHVKVRDPEEFLETSLDLFYKKLDFISLMNALDAQVIGKEYLLQQPVDTVSMGIFNYWFSAGPINLWKTGDIYSEERFRDKITARPEIQKTRLNFQALYFRFNNDGRYDGPTYGLKTPCCKKDGNFWVVDFSTTFRWMKFMLSGPPGTTAALTPR